MASRRPLIIGQAPSFDGSTNFEGKSGARLAKLCGLSRDLFLEVFERRNLIQAYPGQDRSGGDAFPMEEARRAARDIIGELLGRETVLIGGAVVSAFGMSLQRFTWYPFPFNGAFAHSPHPSGVSHWWNDTTNAEAAARFWRDLAGRALEKAGR